MQESGPVSPIEGQPDQSPAQSVAQVVTTSSEKPGKTKKKKAAAKPKPPKRASDPVIRWLVLGIAAVVVVWLVTMLSAMIFGLLTPPSSPRTSAERDLMVLTGTVQSGKATTQTYAQYVGTLISAGQLAKAQQALDQALKIVKKDKSYLYAQQADLLLAQKDYQGTVEAADKAIAEAEKELEAFMDANVKANRKRGAAAVMPSSHSTAALAKAEALMASKDIPNAIKAFDIYIKESPADSDILVRRAQAKVEVGDKAGATKDFKAALKFIPDYQPALDGLKQIGADK